MENKNIKYPIITYNGGCMFIEPLTVNNNYVPGKIWQVRITKEIRGFIDEHQQDTTELDEIRIPVGTYTFTRYLDNEGHWDDILLYDLRSKRFVQKRFVDDPSGSYVSMVFNTVIPWTPGDIDCSWAILSYGVLPGLVRCYCYNKDHFESYRCSETFINISRIYSPGEYIDGSIMVLFHAAYNKNCYTSYVHAKDITIYFPEGEYFGDIHHIGTQTSAHPITVIGDGPDKTIFRHTDKEGKDIEAGWSETRNVIYKDIKILNHSFLQYAFHQNKEDAILEFDNVHLEWTFNKESSYMLVLYQENLRFKFINSKLTGSALYCGIYIEGPTNYLIENSFFKANSWHSAINTRSCSGGIIRDCEIINGITGIFHGTSKKYLIQHTIIENCKLDGQKEESIAFDCFGNNTGANPYLCDCSVVHEAEMIEDGTTLLRLMIGKIRRIEGDHPNEYYIVDTQADIDNEVKPAESPAARLTDSAGKTNAEWMEENLDDLSQFYGVFNINAGKGYTGTFAKIKRIEKNGSYFYIYLERKMNKTGMEPTGSPTSSLVKDINTYTITISSGFFYCKILNNQVKNNPQTGISLYNSFYGGLMSGNVIQNCRDTTLTGAHMLAKHVNNGAYGNVISNNVLIDVKGDNEDHSGLKLSTDYGTTNTYNNIVTDNILINTNLVVRNTKGCKVDGNNIQNSNVRISNSETTTFGSEENRPDNALPGQTYYNQTSQQLEMWTGSSWIVK